MIHLITGIPGSSKTLNALAYIDSNPDFSQRPKYYIRIKELTLGWTELTEAEVKNWEALPDGSIIVIDEAQYIFPTRDPKKPLPDFILALSEHRHRGFDFFIITQSPMLLDAGLRRFVGKHWHFERVFGMQSAKRFEWEKCQSDVDDHFVRKAAVTTRVPFNKKYYGCYKSAEIHTVKRKIPMKVFIPFILLALVIGGGWYHFHDRFDAPTVVQSTPEKSSNTSIDPLGFSSFSDSKRDHVVTTEQYINERMPRVADIPSSAPIYDELIKPVSFPRLQCLRRERTGHCQCYTQQATKIDVSASVCNSVVDNGYFDPTINDRNQSSAAEAAKGSEAPRPAG